MNELLPMLRAIIVLVVSLFMPFTAISFFMIMIPQKEKEFTKSIKEMNIKTSRKVRDSYSKSKYIFPVLFATLICFGFITAFTFGGLGTDLSDSVFLSGPYFGEKDENGQLTNLGVVNQSFSVLSWAFIGGFIWSAQNIIRRFIAADLSPSVYYSAGIRIILASAVALVLSFLLGDESSDIFSLKSSLSAIALLAGMFPERILNYLMRRYQEFVAGNSVTETSLSLYNIEGISIYHKERLEEIGIDNAQNLATASLTQMIAETPFDARQLLDWIGQAKLICYVKDDIHKLRAIGIRSVFDLLRGDKSTLALRELSDTVGIETPILEVVHGQVVADKGINALFGFQEKKDDPQQDAEVTPIIDSIDFSNPEDVEAKG